MRAWLACEVLLMDSVWLLLISLIFLTKLSGMFASEFICLIDKSAAITEEIMAINSAAIAKRVADMEDDLASSRAI